MKEERITTRFSKTELNELYEMANKKGYFKISSYIHDKALDTSRNENSSLDYLKLLNLTAELSTAINRYDFYNKDEEWFKMKDVEGKLWSFLKMQQHQSKM